LVSVVLKRNDGVIGLYVLIAINSAFISDCQNCQDCQRSPKLISGCAYFLMLQSKLSVEQVFNLDSLAIVNSGNCLLLPGAHAH
jgi:hypothetical protein